MIVPFFYRLDSASIESVRTEGQEGESFEMPTLLVQIGGSGQNVEIDQIDQHQATFSLWPSQTIEQQARVVI